MQTEENDYQFWIEQVGEGGASVIIEDGQVKAHPTDPLAQSEPEITKGVGGKAPNKSASGDTLL